MLSREAIQLLTKLKKVQQIPDGRCILSENSSAFTTFAVRNAAPISVNVSAGSVESLLRELEKAEYIILWNNVETTCQVTSKGWHRKELETKALAREFVRSLLFPVLAAIITSLIVNKFI